MPLRQARPPTTAGSDDPAAAPIPLRPHHLVCLVGFRGHGYSDSFTANMAALAARLRGPGGETTPLVIRPMADAICLPCPRRRGSGCRDAGRIAALDRRHGERLGLETGARLSWGAALARIRRKVHPDDLATLCAGCRWLPLGFCSDALETLRKTGAAPPFPEGKASKGEAPSGRDTTSGSAPLPSRMGDAAT